MSNLDTLITSREACDLLGVGRTQLGRFINSGRLTPVKQLPGKSGAYLFNRDQVADLARGHRAELAARVDAIDAALAAKQSEAVTS